jgi:hypothetical protein
MKILQLIALGATLFVPLRAQLADTEWTEIGRWTGTGSKNTDDFTINGSKWRIRWIVEGEPSQLSVWLHKPDGTVVENVGSSRGPGSDETVVRGGGTYYLKLTGLGKWEVVVEDAR